MRGAKRSPLARSPQRGAPSTRGRARARVAAADRAGSAGARSSSSRPRTPRKQKTTKRRHQLPSLPARQTRRCRSPRARPAGPGCQSGARTSARARRAAGRAWLLGCFVFCRGVLVLRAFWVCPCAYNGGGRRRRRARETSKPKPAAATRRRRRRVFFYKAGPRPWLSCSCQTNRRVHTTK